MVGWRRYTMFGSPACRCAMIAPVILIMNEGGPPPHPGAPRRPGSQQGKALRGGAADRCLDALRAGDADRPAEEPNR